MAIFKGAGVALITPFTDSGEVNYEKLEEILEEQIAGGTDAIISCGTTGESSTMTHEEHIQVVRYTCQVVKGRIPVVLQLHQGGCASVPGGREGGGGRAALSDALLQ